MGYRLSSSHVLHALAMGVIVEMIRDEGPAYTYSGEDFDKLCTELLGEGMPVSAADVIAYMVSRGDLVVTPDAGGDQ